MAIPDEYIGKPLHVYIYSEDEIAKLPVPQIKKKRPSEYFGTLSKEEGERMQIYVDESRKEWERNI